MKKNQNKNTIVVYQTKSGALELRGDFKAETLWANRMQMAKIFEVNPQAISKHIQNIYSEKELTKKATSSKMELVQNESGRIVKRQIDIYNLDILIAVGYRINSGVGTKFRQWATKTLHRHIVDGYTINKKQLTKNYDAFMKVVDNLRGSLPAGSLVSASDTLELVKLFASTWLSLDAYDKGVLTGVGVTKRAVGLTAQKLWKDITIFKTSLMNSGEATELFAGEKARGSLEGIIGNVLQSFGGRELYPTVEAKAAHLLYFIIKNHPFNDGNKRTGAYTFVWYLHKAKVLNTTTITPVALTALTILIAESDPKEKEKIVGLVVSLISQRSV